MNIWGENYKISIFGESHGEGIGVVIDGIPAGTCLDLDEINFEMKRRAPGQNAMSTPRAEKDAVKILSGFWEGKTTGTPLAGVIMNTNTISKDYTPELIRPGHADFTGFSKYGEAHDFRGGGHFSGRITAPLVFAGAIAKQILAKEGIKIGAHIYNIGEIYDTPYDGVNLTEDVFGLTREKILPVLDDNIADKMEEYILKNKNEQNSVGGVIECGITGAPVGIGAPFFGSVESRISSMMFSIPAIKGIEFGAGFGFAKMTGKDANDEFYTEDGKIKTYTNNNAGINGGITNGMPVVFRTVVKPTPSISQSQKTVDIKKMENTEVVVKGRHDPCIVGRAVPVIEAGAAIAILDMLKVK